MNNIKNPNPQTIDRLWQALDLCSRFAGEKTGKIAVSHDRSNCAAALALAVISAITLAKKQCICFENQPVFVTRRGIAAYNAGGGIHVFSASPESIKIIFIDSSGNNSDFCDGSIQLANFCNIKEIIPILSYKYYYIRETVQKSRIRSLGFNVLAYAKNPETQGILTAALCDLDCCCRLYTDELCINSETSRESFSNAVSSSGCDVGIYIDTSSESFALFDNENNVISGSLLNKLCRLVMFRLKPLSHYAARLAAPDIICEPSKTETDLQFTFEYDPIGAFLKILDYLKSCGSTLSMLLEEISKPNFNGKSTAFDETIITGTAADFSGIFVKSKNKA